MVGGFGAHPSRSSFNFFFGQPVLEIRRNEALMLAYHETRRRGELQSHHLKSVPPEFFSLAVTGTFFGFFQKKILCKQLNVLIKYVIQYYTYSQSPLGFFHFFELGTSFMWAVLYALFPKFVQLLAIVFI